MQYVNLPVAVLDSPQFIGAEPMDRGTWVCLLRYCAGQENGGVIVACRGWSDRKWQQIARVTKSEVERVVELWRFVANDLTIFGYPIDQEQMTKRLRERGRLAARKRWKLNELMPDGIASGNGVAHAKDKIREDKERPQKPRPDSPLLRKSSRLKSGLHLPISPDS